MLLPASIRLSAIFFAHCAGGAGAMRGLSKLLWWRNDADVEHGSTGERKLMPAPRQRSARRSMALDDGDTPSLATKPAGGLYGPSSDSLASRSTATSSGSVAARGTASAAPTSAVNSPSWLVRTPTSPSSAAAVDLGGGLGFGFGFQPDARRRRKEQLPGPTGSDSSAAAGQVLPTSRGREPEEDGGDAESPGRKSESRSSVAVSDEGRLPQGAWQFSPHPDAQVDGLSEQLQSALWLSNVAATNSEDASKPHQQQQQQRGLLSTANLKEHDARMSTCCGDQGKALHHSIHHREAQASVTVAHRGEGDTHQTDDESGTGILGDGGPESDLGSIIPSVMGGESADLGPQYWQRESLISSRDWAGRKSMEQELVFSGENRLGEEPEAPLRIVHPGVDGGEHDKSLAEVNPEQGVMDNLTQSPTKVSWLKGSLLAAVPEAPSRAAAAREQNRDSERKLLTTARWRAAFESGFFREAHVKVEDANEASQSEDGDAASHYSEDWFDYMRTYVF